MHPQAVAAYIYDLFSPLFLFLSTKQCKELLTCKQCAVVLAHQCAVEPQVKASA